MRGKQSSGTGPAPGRRQTHSRMIHWRVVHADTPPAGRTVLPAQTAPGHPFRNAIKSDSPCSLRRPRPRQILVITSTTTPCSNMRSARAQMRHTRLDSVLLFRGRVTSHDRAIHGCARTEPGAYPIRLRLQPFTNREFTHTFSFPDRPSRRAPHVRDHVQFVATVHRALRRRGASRLRQPWLPPRRDDHRGIDPRNLRSCRSTAAHSFPSPTMS